MALAGAAGRIALVCDYLTAGDRYCRAARQLGIPPGIIVVQVIFTCQISRIHRIISTSRGYLFTGSLALPILGLEMRPGYS